MSHEITNKDSLYYVGETPWHGLGKRVDHVLTASEAILAAGLNWEIERLPVFIDDDESKEYQAIRRSDTKDIFQVCKKSYTPVQNMECFTMFDEVVGTGQAKYEIAGSLQGGRKIWMLARLPFDFKVKGKDEIRSYVTLINGHDGLMSVSMYETPIRVVCANTLRISFSNRTNVCSARHRQAGKTNFVNRAQIILANARQYFLDFKEASEFMAKKEMKDLEMNTFLNELFNVKEVKKEEIATRTINNIATVKNLILTGKGNEVVGIRGTRWAAFNGVTEFIDHVKTVKGDNSRLANSWLGNGADLREKAFALLTELK